MSERSKGFAAGAFQALTSGSASVPYLLLMHYRNLKLSESDMMLIIHLLAFKEKEGKTFPTIEEIQTRMADEPDRVIDTIQSLMQRGIVNIVEEVDPDTGVQSERYDLEPLFGKLSAILDDAAFDDFDELPSDESEEDSFVHVAEAVEADDDARERSLFTVFEREFGRPLSPMECETISAWLDKDQYAEALILAALKEAVFAGKLNFRYIDRILLDWNRNRIRTVEEAREYAKQFRGK